MESTNCTTPLLLSSTLASSDSCDDGSILREDPVVSISTVTIAFNDPVVDTSINPPPPPPLIFSLANVIIVFLPTAFGGFLYGYDIAATSFAIVQQEQTSWIVSSSTSVQGLIVAASSIGALIGSFTIYYYDVAEYLGRRVELRYSSLFYMVGALCETIAGYIWPLSKSIASNTKLSSITSSVLVLGLLLVGRIVYGFGIAFAMHSGPTYLAEMTPPSVRGVFVSLKEASIVMGILMGYVIGFIFCSSSSQEGDLRGWRYSYAFTLLFSTSMLLVSSVIPESCRWLLLNGRQYEALASLRFIYPSGDDAQNELDEMVLMNNSPRDDQVHDIGVKDSIWNHRSYRAPLTAGVGLVILQQVTGQPSVLSHAAPILRGAGLSEFSSIYIGLFKLVSTLSAASTVESFGRKKLLYFGITCMMLSLMALACFASFDKADVVTLNENDTTTSIMSDELKNSEQHQQFIVMAAFFVYVAGYQFSFGPISWLIISEVFPLRLRGQAVAYAVQMNFLFKAIVQFSVALVQHVIGYNATFGIFAFFAAYSLYFVKMYVPETKGLSLEQIEQKFIGMDSGSSATSLSTIELTQLTFHTLYTQCGRLWNVQFRDRSD